MPALFYLRLQDAGLGAVGSLLLLTKLKKRAKTTKLTAENWPTKREKAKHSKFQVKITIKGCFKAKKAKRSWCSNIVESDVLTKLNLSMSSKAIYPKEVAPSMSAAGLLGPDLVYLNGAASCCRSYLPSSQCNYSTGSSFTATTRASISKWTASESS